MAARDPRPSGPVSERDPESIIRNLTDLSAGAPVVHEDHGVGRYLGLETLEIDQRQAEFLMLEYAGSDKLYVPVASLHLVSRYTGSDPDSAPLHRLGSQQWEKARRKAAKQVRDVAAELLDLYSRRLAREGFAFPLDEKLYAEFASGFPFEETPDQQQAIDAVISDLASDKPMDRWSAVTWVLAKPRSRCAPHSSLYRPAARWPCWSPPPCWPSSIIRPSVTGWQTGRSKLKCCHASAPASSPARS